MDDSSQALSGQLGAILPRRPRRPHRHPLRPLPFPFREWTRTFCRQFHG